MLSFPNILNGVQFGPTNSAGGVKDAESTDCRAGTTRQNPKTYQKVNSIRLVNLRSTLRNVIFLEHVF